MKRALTAPGYIYSAVKDDAKSQAFFEDQYLRFVDRYDDVLADDPALHDMGYRRHDPQVVAGRLPDGRGLGAELSVCAARHARHCMRPTMIQPTAYTPIPRQTAQPVWCADPSSQNRTKL